MCIRLFRRKKHREKETNYDNSFPKPVRYYGDLKQEVDENTQANSYYSPHCFRRPLHCKRLCINCTGYFYSYEVRQYCSNECKISNIERTSAFKET